MGPRDADVKTLACVHLEYAHQNQIGCSAAPGWAGVRRVGLIGDCRDARSGAPSGLCPVMPADNHLEGWLHRGRQAGACQIMVCRLAPRPQLPARPAAGTVALWSGVQPTMAGGV